MPALFFLSFEHSIMSNTVFWFPWAALWLEGSLCRISSCTRCSYRCGKILEFLSSLIKWDLCTPEVPACGDQTPLNHRSGNIYGFRWFFFSLFNFEEIEEGYIMYILLVICYFPGGIKECDQIPFWLLNQCSPETTLVFLTFHQSTDLAAPDIWISD